MRDKLAHKWRMAERRERQLSRTANCSAFGRKMVRVQITGKSGAPETIMIGVERLDEQGAYRNEHWKKQA